MPSWKVYRGSDNLFEGSVTFATVTGAELAPYDLNGGTLTWHMGSTWEYPMYTRSSAGGTNFSFTGTTTGIYTFSLSPQDTQTLVATTYWFDIWLKTSGNREYCLTVGTLTVRETVGTL